MTTPTPLRRAAAELVGTFILVTAGCGAIAVNQATGALTHVGVAATFGLVIMVLIAALGHLSGAHFNPAVTLAFALHRHFPWREVPLYWSGQLLGAVAGAAALRWALGPAASLGVTLPTGSPGQAFGIELLMTLILMLVVTAVATDTRAVSETAALAIGGTIALEALIAGPLTGASMNPARSFGPALVSGVWTAHWVYWLAPLAGASLGASLYRFLQQGAAE
jgi:MIP family channel proteins